MAEVFVFGSNEAGRHGAGSAKHAMLHHGAVYGEGYGRQGNSFAIPTKNISLKVLPLGVIQIHIALFLMYAREHPDDIFNVVDVGCGLAGYTPEQIAPMFGGHPKNVKLSNRFMEVLNARATV